MRYQAKHRFADVSARKIRPFADLIRGRNVDEALQLLRFVHNRGAKLLEAVVKSAYGNADDQECQNLDDLIVAEARVDGAPMYKRIQPRARGTAFGIKRRLAHIIVTLAEPEEEVVETTAAPAMTTTTPTAPAAGAGPQPTTPAAPAQ